MAQGIHKTNLFFKMDVEIFVILKLFYLRKM